MMQNDHHLNRLSIRFRRISALIALLLLIPAPTIGTVLAMHLEITRGTWIGQGVYGLSKVWIVVLPALWLLVVERRKPAWSRPRKGGLGIGLLLGLVISALITAAYMTVGEALIDPETVRQAAVKNGIGTLERYIALSVGICFVNALIEEYVWRWFVFEKWAVFTGKHLAVVLAALSFTLHHVFALSAQFGVIATFVGSIGIFIGGAVWSWCYMRYESIWPGYLSHVLVDIAAMVIGWHMIFVVAS